MGAVYVYLLLVPKDDGAEARPVDAAVPTVPDGDQARRPMAPDGEAVGYDQADGKGYGPWVEWWWWWVELAVLYGAPLAVPLPLMRVVVMSALVLRIPGENGAVPEEGKWKFDEVFP